MAASQSQAFKSAFHPLASEAKPAATNFNAAFNLSHEASPVSQAPRGRLPGQLPLTGFNSLSPFAAAYGAHAQHPNARNVGAFGVSPYVAATSFMPSLAAAAAGFSGHPSLAKDYSFSGFMRGMSAMAYNKDKLHGASTGLNGLHSVYRFDSSASDASSCSSDK